MLIDRPGIYAMPESQYLADPVIEPSLSRTDAHRLITQSPAHCYAGHPRLGGSTDRGDSSDEADLGSVVHQIFLLGEARVRQVPFDAYTSKEAKRQRDEARAAGLIPVKTGQYDRAMRLVERLERFRAKTGYFTHGKAEQVLVWQEGRHWSRARVDWLPDDPGESLLDLKTTSTTATERTWARTAFERGMGLQMAHYCRGSEMVRGEPPNDMVFVVIETLPPYEIRAFVLSPIAVEFAQQQEAEAREIWARCREANEWPGYGTDLVYIDPPPWMQRDWDFAHRPKPSMMEAIAG
jgi:hypothetical protein